MDITQYIGRTVDVLAYRNGMPSGEVQLTADLADELDSGQIGTGIQKLAQRFLLELLTEKGSMIYLPTRGCDFMRQARLGSWQTVMDIMSSFSASLVDIKENLITEQSSSDPTDEQFSDAELVNVTLNAGSATIYVRVVSAAGTARTFITPITVTL